MHSEGNEGGRYYWAKLKGNIRNSLSCASQWQLYFCLVVRGSVMCMGVMTQVMTDNNMIQCDGIIN